MTALADATNTVGGVKPPPSRRRTELLDAAATVFESAGIRASITEVAAACGVLTGSLYHHFDSKEAIVIELVERYVDDLERLAAESAALVGDGSGATPLDAVEAFAVAIADCAIRHRAALLLTFHEPPTSYGPELVELAARIPVAITAAMQALLDRADEAGDLRPSIDRRVLANRLCQNMLHVGVGVFHRDPAAIDVPALRCRMLLRGIAAPWPAETDLDASAARSAADAVIRDWPARSDEADDSDARVLAAARREFGRRGYEATTVRDVAAAAGTTTKAVYRLVRSKEELLWRILVPYATTLIAAWDAVLDAGSSPLETLDALLWLNINVLDRFNEENNIISVFMQFAPPSSPDLDVQAAAGESGREVPFSGQLRKIQRLLADGERSGQFHLPPAAAEVAARCAFALIWTPHDIIEEVGLAGALAFNRQTLLLGAAAGEDIDTRPPGLYQRGER